MPCRVENNNSRLFNTVDFIPLHATETLIDATTASPNHNAAAVAGANLWLAVEVSFS
jgi:hypothetical protein